MGKLQTDYAAPSQGDRPIEIHGNALNSAIVSGDGNKVVIYHYHLTQQACVETAPDLCDIGANPYRGLAAFQVEDAAVYFGREAQIDRLWHRLQDLQAQALLTKPRLLPILGASGSGKSSLVRAGLLPELARHPLPGYSQLQVAVMTPGEKPVEALAVVLARIATQDLTPVEKAQEFERVLRQGNEQTQWDGLRRIANALPAIDTAPLVLLVDQFEEVYSLCKEPVEQTVFIENLLDAVSSATGRVSVVITCRSDFLEAMQRHPKLEQLIASDLSVIVPGMSAEELRHAIAEPAKRAGHPLDEAVVDRLVEQTEGREGALPLLQFALTRIWEGLKQGKLPTETLTAIGGVGGALAGEAQRIYQSLSASEQDIARRLFMGLVQLGEGTRDTRRRVPVESLISAKDDIQQVWQVLNRFSSSSVRLITLSTVDGKAVAEVTHEALFGHWQLLKDWLSSQRDLIRQQRKIEAAMEDWQAAGKRRGYLLQGRQLTDADQFRKQQADRFPLSQTAETFIRESLRQYRLRQLGLFCLLAVPLILVEPYLRKRTVQGYYQVLANGNSSEKRGAVLGLVRGCPGQSTFSWIPDYFAERLFGNCRTLQGQNLQGVNLQSLDLQDVNLQGANLEGANLRAANFTSANLSQANFTNTTLNGARFDRADLRGIKGWSSAGFRPAKLCNTLLPESAKLASDRDCGN